MSESQKSPPAARGYIVAIDGPAGAGKSTIARMVAKRLGLVRVDTGAIYRTVALVAEEQGLESEEAIAAVCPTIPITFLQGRVLLGDRDVSKVIRTEAISQRSSRVSTLPKVRQALLELQRRLARSHPEGAVLEGRDIGTVVFPEAEVKIFLTASAEERARRRMKDLEPSATYDLVLAGIQERDQRDRERAVAPLKASEDAVLVDTTEKPLEEVLDDITRIVRERLAQR